MPTIPVSIKSRLYLRLHAFYLRIWSIILPLRATLDTTDNSVTINRSLYNMLLHLGIETNNRIVTFKYDVPSVNTVRGDVSPRSRYAFCLYPDDAQGKYFSRLQVGRNKQLGWELLHPSVNRIFFDWGVPHEQTTLLVDVIPSLVSGSDNQFIYLKLTNPYTGK